MAIKFKRDFTAVHKSSGGRTPVGIVLHDTTGSGAIGGVKYLANPSDGRVVSVDFVITRGGSIYQLTSDIKKVWCYHAGRKTKSFDYATEAYIQAGFFNEAYGVKL